ncbi:MAG TPA: hypothetical protein VH327_00990 [Gammaproteobacteria bacterium]|jgi:hypothetical protein|nr:hypothetical protein [Gammaproteobacteria bacterium]
MSSKVAISISSNEIRKSFTNGSSTQVSLRDKPDFKVKKYQGSKSQFSTATLCADPGATFTACGFKE